MQFEVAMRKILMGSFVFCGTLFGASCEQILSDPRGFFSKEPADEELLQSDFGCKGSLAGAEFLQNLKSAASEIRDENIDCVGNEALLNEKRLERTLAFAGMDGEGFLSYAKEKNYARISEKSLEALEFYSEHKIGNFIAYGNFMGEVPAAREALRDYFAVKFNKNDADELASAVIAEFIAYAAKDRKAGDYGELELALKGGVSADEFRALLFSKDFTIYELDNALDLALLLGYDERFSGALIERGAQVNAGEENSLFYAMNNVQSAKFMISKGALVGYKNSLGQTPIFFAAAAKNYELVKFLIYSHASVNVRQIGSAEAQALASLGERSDGCERSGAGKTLLMFAAQKSTKQIVELLVKSGANEKAVDESGLNALDYALAGGEVATQSYLRSLGLSPTQTSDDFTSDPQDAPEREN